VIGTTTLCVGKLGNTAERCGENENSYKQHSLIPQLHYEKWTPLLSAPPRDNTETAELNSHHRPKGFPINISPITYHHCNSATIRYINVQNNSKQSRIWGSHSGGYEQSCPLGYIVVLCAESQPTFWRNTSPLSSRNEAGSIATCFTMVYCLT
jgi:hypothetical protein